MHELVSGIPITDDYFGLNHQKLIELETELFKLSPWKEVLVSSDLIRIVFQVGFKFSDRIPKGYSGILECSPIASLIPEFENELISYLESLPRSYSICFPLPKMQRYGVGSVKIANGIDLVDPTAAPHLKDHLASDNALLMTSVTPKFSRDCAYIVFSVPGYVDKTLSAYSTARAYAQLKHFLFLALSRGILKKLSGANNFFTYRLDRRPHSSAVEVIIHNEDFSELEGIWLPEETSKYLQDITADEELLEVNDGKSLLSYRKAVTPEEKANSLGIKFSMMEDFLNISQDNTDVIPVRTAIEWYFDAEVTQNETVSFIHRWIGIEAILGPRENSGRLTDKLSDRYSYLLGKTASERVKLKNQFEEVYAARGELVHGRQSTLSRTDSILNDKARWMLHSIIAEEANGLMKTLRKKKIAKN
ncbi:MAG: hypothetical protein ACYC1T_03295 [Sulfuricaulis sp.]